MNTLKKLSNIQYNRLTEELSLKNDALGMYETISILLNQIRLQMGINKNGAEKKLPDEIRIFQVSEVEYISIMGQLTQSYLQNIKLS